MAIGSIAYCLNLQATTADYEPAAFERKEDVPHMSQAEPALVWRVHAQEKERATAAGVSRRAAARVFVPLAFGSPLTRR
jgi:hypothetical protein